MPSLGAWRGFSEATRWSTSAMVRKAARATSSSALSPVSTCPKSARVERHSRPSRRASASPGKRRSTFMAAIRRPADPSRR